jgi:hypothetical protein
MKKPIVLTLAVLLLLSACNGRKTSELERFAGETVATIVGSPEPTNPHESIATKPAETASLVETPPVSEDSSSTPLITDDSMPTAELTIPTDEGSYPFETPGTQTNNPITTPSPFEADWSGAWNIWFQDRSGAYLHSNMTLQVQGNNVSGSAKIGEVEYTFIGSNSDDKDQVKGEWKATGSNSIFWWIMTRDGQFSGSWGERFGFCGNKQTIQPADCRRIPPT